ncbi:MAG: hypothetical protein ACJ0OY_07055 [Dehalococcoidia bacterium]|nr:hypothetical protein [Chloroflexota bacterium]|tara:strand:- start:753 stop:1223 length:471 start_codon:yes stop_codon:yes gene_type:complete
MSDAISSKLTNELNDQLNSAIELINGLSETDLEIFYSEDTGEEGPMTVRRLLHRINTHHKDHIQHIIKVRKKLGFPVSEVETNIAEIRASRAYLTSIIDSLIDENMTKDIEEKTDLGNLASVSAGENRYTIKRIVGHVMEMTNNRLNHIRDSIKNK